MLIAQLTGRCPSGVRIAERYWSWYFALRIALYESPKCLLLRLMKLLLSKGRHVSISTQTHTHTHTFLISCFIAQHRLAWITMHPSPRTNTDLLILLQPMPFVRAFIAAVRLTPRAAWQLWPPFVLGLALHAGRSFQDKAGLTGKPHDFM